MFTTKKSQSPLPPEARKLEIALSFGDAIRAVVEGKRIKRSEWTDKDEYGFMKNTYLTIHNGKGDHNWIVSEGDILAIDWVTVGNNVN
jgi:hypothetical protein